MTTPPAPLPRSTRSWLRALRPALLAAAAVAVLVVVRPGVVLNGGRSPVVWAVVVATFVTARLLALIVRRLGGGSRLAAATSVLTVSAVVATLLAPSFRQRSLDEGFPAPVAVAQPAASLAAPVAAPAPPATPPPIPGSSPVTSPGAVAPPAPVLLGGGSLQGVGHSASGRVSLHEVDGRQYLRFEDVDIEGTPGPEVHLVRSGRRSPDGAVPLGDLKAERGSFSYLVPDDVDAADGWSVLVWCRPYDTPVARAALRPA